MAVEDLIAQGRAWLDSVRLECMAEPVTYRRGTLELDLFATCGRSDMTIADANGFAITEFVTDFLIVAAGPDETFTEPQRGDRIIRTNPGVIYEVLDVGPGGCWRWTDQTRTVWRIHAKEVATA